MNYDIQNARGLEILEKCKEFDKHYGYSDDGHVSWNFFVTYDVLLKQHKRKEVLESIDNYSNIQQNAIRTASDSEFIKRVNAYDFGKKCSYISNNEFLTYLESDARDFENFSYSPSPWRVMDDPLENEVLTISEENTKDYKQNSIGFRGFIFTLFAIDCSLEKRNISFTGCQIGSLEFSNIAHESQIEITDNDISRLKFINCSPNYARIMGKVANIELIDCNFMQGVCDFVSADNYIERENGNIYPISSFKAVNSKFRFDFVEHEFKFFSVDNCSFESQFKSCTFSDRALFTNTIFDRDISFKKAKFHGVAVFDNVVFEQKADFQNTVFSKIINLDHQDDAHQFKNFYAASFINTKFKSFAYFMNAKFAMPPHFGGAEAPAMMFDETTIIKNPKECNQTMLLSAWSSLIQLMEDSQNIPMKQYFHNKRLESEGRLVNGYKKSLHDIYIMLGEGNNTLKATGILMSIFAFLWLVNNCFIVAATNEYKTAMFYAFELTANDMFPFLGSNHKATHDIMKLFESGSGLKSFVVLVRKITTFFSLICFFMIGLSLRNHFRIKS